MTTEVETGRGSLLGRRAFLGGLVGAGATVLASCGSAPKAVVESCTSKLDLSTVKPQMARAGEVVSSNPDISPAWKTYPKPYTSVPDGPPGNGGTVTTFQQLFAVPPAPLAQNPWWQQWNQRLGVEIQPIQVPNADYVAKLSTLAASGQFPDITYINFNPDSDTYDGAVFQKYLGEGAFNDLTPYLTGKGLEEFPNLQLIPKASWKGVAYGGRIYGVPNCVPVVNGILPCYRKDWAQKLGVDGAKNSKETLKMLTAFAKGSPRGAGKQSWGLARTNPQIWNAMFRVPNNWEVKSNGSLVKDFETPQYREAVDFARQLWSNGVFEPNTLTNSPAQETNLFEGGQIGMLLTGGWGQFGTQEGSIASLTKKTDPQANAAPWVIPGHDGGNGLMIQTGGCYGFGAIPSSIKSEKRIVELLKILNYYEAPFGSTENVFRSYGIEGQMFQYVDGVPTSIKGPWTNWTTVVSNFMAGPSVYYFQDQPEFSVSLQQMEEKLLKISAADPTSGLFSQTWVEQAANLVNLQTDAFNSIISGKKPLSYLDEAISDWKSQGGAAAAKEFAQSLKKCV